jgi:transposase
MEEFDNFKMGYAFMKVKLQLEQWELHKEQVREIMWEAFESYHKDEELYQLCLESFCDASFGNAPF